MGKLTNMNSEQIIAYTGLREDVICLIQGTPNSVLDVGCSNGKLLSYMKKLGSSYLVGIEQDRTLAAEALKSADKIINLNLDEFNIHALDGKFFDLIILADILEHTKNPSLVLGELLKSASLDAQIIISLPNIQHWTAIKNLIIGRWPQRNRGLFDRTHLRFFVFNSIKNLLKEVDLEVEEIKYNYRVVDRPDAKINRFSRYLAVGWLKPYLTYQYVIRSRRIKY